MKFKLIAILNILVRKIDLSICDIHVDGLFNAY